MALEAGARFGPYQVVALIGAGGMGEVYRARDWKLERDVAIKILPEHFTSDPERLARFEREARVMASLNHPRIGAIYGMEDAGGIRGLILELVEGPTLADRLAAGPVSLEDVLSLAEQIAEALEAAHEKGIIHRDLKPANIKIRPDGTVKVLDFGLAKAVGIGGAASDLPHSPTMTSGGTHDGMVLGTPGFMSPEQARGKAVDKRIDIWAFGCVLYEMLAARPAFASDSVADTIAAILHREPGWDSLPDRTPPALRRLLRRCLEKDPGRRLRDIGDARLEIAEARVGVPEVEQDRLPVTRRAEVQFRRLTDFAGLKESPAISPDGKMVAFVSLVKGKRQIWLRLLAGGAPLQVTRDPVDHEHPRWSPDSSAILYYSPSDLPGGPGALWEVSAFGGNARRVATSLGGGDFSSDGKRVALFRPAGERVELAIVTRDGSRTEAIIPLTPGYTYTLARWSPNGRWIACQRGSSTAIDMCVCVAPVGGGEMRELCHSSWVRGLSWLPDGSGLIYSSSLGSTLLYPPVFNVRSVAVDGTGDRQLTFGDVSYLEPDAHPSGRLVATRVRSQSDIWRFPIAGSPLKNTRGGTRLTRQTAQVQVPSVSPDGQRIVYLSDNGGHSNLWVVDTASSDARQVTFEEDPAVTIGVPMWAPAGNRIVFIIGRGRQVELWLVEPDGSNLRQVVSHGWYSCWSGDGQWVYYNSSRGIDQIEKLHVDHQMPVQVRSDGYASAVADASTLYYVKSLRPETPMWADLEIRRAQPEDGPSELLARVPGWRVPMAPITFAPSLSPDGRWLAAPLLDGSTTNLWMQPTSGGPMQPVTDFGERNVLITRRVSWSADSRFLYAAVAEIDGDVVLFDGLL